MIGTRRRIATLATVLLLAACAGTPQTRFHTLLAPAERKPAAAAPPAAYAIDVQAVSVPAQVDVPQIVLRRGDGELALVETRQWAAPLGQELRLALSEWLARELGAQDVSRLGAVTDVPVRRVKLAVSRFDSVLGRSARIDAQWQIRDDARGLSLSCTSQVQESVGASYDELVQGHQRALARLGAEIALALRAFDGAAPPACPRPPAQSPAR
ncbi:PqiC family protein [Fontimonas sp. SYSU GA230001]|uniref:PqiC family protein n=1 Tax=Fontimonas sp. SYSU GA230001 TaxID=3142450 RepID=UPI0032B3428C